MSLVTVLPVAVRRLLVRRPWIHWVVVTAAAASSAAIVAERVGRIDAARAAWGDERSVWVAAADVAPGAPLAVSVRRLPVAVVPLGALDPDHDDLPALARQHVTAGEIVTVVDVAPTDLSSPLALVPDGWLAVPIVESVPSGAAVGDRVRIVSGGVVLAAEAVVVGHHEQVTLTAVPSDVAAMIPAAADADGVTLLLVP